MKNLFGLLLCLSFFVSCGEVENDDDAQGVKEDKVKPEAPINAKPYLNLDERPKCTDELSGHFAWIEGESLTVCREKAWVEFDVKGPAGEKGDKGDKGDTGSAGAQGEKGATGAQGEKGRNGTGSQDPGEPWGYFTLSGSDFSPVPGIEVVRYAPPTTTDGYMIFINLSDGEFQQGGSACHYTNSSCTSACFIGGSYGNQKELSMDKDETRLFHLKDELDDPVVWGVTGSNPTYYKYQGFPTRSCTSSTEPVALWEGEEWANPNSLSFPLGKLYMLPLSINEVSSL